MPESDVDARLAAAEGTEEREAILRDVLETREAELADLREERDRLQGERDGAKRAYAEALAPGSVFDAEALTERFDLSELREKYDDASTPTPTLSDTEPALQSGATSTETATLSSGDRDRVAELEARLDELPATDRGLFKHQREEIEAELAELRGEA